MEQNYYIPVSGKELRNSELYITLALIVAGGFYKNKAYVTVKSEYAKDSLKNACKALNMKCENMKCDKCKDRLYLKPISKLSKVLAKQRLVPDFDNETWADFREHVPKSWKDLTHDQILYLNASLKELIGRKVKDGSITMTIRTSKYLAEELANMFSKTGYIYLAIEGYNSCETPVWHLVYKFYEPAKHSDDISDLL